MGAMKVSNVFTPPQIIMMSWKYAFLPVILGAVVSCQDVLSNPVVELTVRPGQNVTLYCDYIPLDAVAVDPAAPDCGQCWMLLVILCPSSALLLSLLSSLVVYLRCRRKDEDLHVAQTSPSSRDVTSIRNQDEVGLCYATLDIPLRSQRPKKKRVQPSEFSTYSAINTKRM
ncbi:unnamed protein product [Arctogadus glacialis]